MKFSQWEISRYDRPAAVGLARAGINPLVAVLLASRGIEKLEDTVDILADDASVIMDPFLLKDMDKAVERINLAIESGEKIAVYGDYDVDGMTASCLIAGVLRERSVECEIYIPGRIEEGYGVHTAALDYLHSLGVTLVVTVDCGITAVAETQYAASLGMELVITDHHECKETLPAAVAVVNPKRPDCEYPNKSLAGVGVAMKLACALTGGEAEKILEKYGDLVAIGTIADVMSVMGENRHIIRRGLEILNQRRRPGLRALINEAGLQSREITAGDIGFTLSPRLNAAGRMGRSSLSVELLLTESDTEAVALVAELNDLNKQRRALESDIFDSAIAMTSPTGGGNPIVLASHGWYQGVMGIVASRMAERYLLPSVMICLEDDGLGRGSCRSFAGFNLYAAIESCKDLLINFGGHEMAAGLTIAEENIDELRTRLTEYFHRVHETPPVPTLKVDLEVIKPGLLTFENVAALKRLEPYGNGNRPSVLCLRDAKLDAVTSVGGGRHTKLRVSKFGETFDCICFSKTVEELGVSRGGRCDIAFEPQINEFCGRKSVQLLLVDVCVRSE